MELLDFFTKYKIPCTKFDPHPFIQEYYDKEFSKKKKYNINLLEIGVREGNSLMLWRDFFINGKIYGVDVDYIGVENTTNFVQNAYSKNFIKKLENNYFDYIIEDGSHELKHQKFTINNYVSKLKTGGKLIIEDVGCKDRTSTKIPPDRCIKILIKEIEKK